MTAWLNLVTTSSLPGHDPSPVLLHCRLPHPAPIPHPSVRPSRVLYADQVWAHPSLRRPRPPTPASCPDAFHLRVSVDAKLMICCWIIFPSPLLLACGSPLPFPLPPFSSPIHRPPSPQYGHRPALHPPFHLLIFHCLSHPAGRFRGRVGLAHLVRRAVPLARLRLRLRLVRAVYIP